MSCKEGTFSAIVDNTVRRFSRKTAQLGKYCVQMKHSGFKWKTVLRGIVSS